MISYGELVLQRTPAVVEVVGEAPEWTLMPLSLLVDPGAVWLHEDGCHVSVGDSAEPRYAVVGWDCDRKALILYRCEHRRIVRGPLVVDRCDVPVVDPGDIPPVEDEEINK